MMSKSTFSGLGYNVVADDTSLSSVV